MLIFPALLIPLATQMNIEISEVLKLSFYMYLFFGVTALPWGMAADKLGAKPLFILQYLGSGLSAIAAFYYINSPTGLMVSLGFIGIFSGIYHPTGLGMIAKEVERVSVAMGYNGMFGNLGLGVAQIAGGLIIYFFGINSVYLFVAGANFTGLLFMAIFPLNESAKNGAVKTYSRNVSPFLVLLIAMMLGGFVYRGATVITPALFELRIPEVFGFLQDFSSFKLSENLIATTVTSFIFLVGIFAQYTGGRLAEKYKPQYCYLIFHLITIPAALITMQFTNLPLILTILIYLFFLLGMQPAENTLVAKLSPEKLKHSAYGLKFILTFGVGSMAVNFVSKIVSGYGIENVYPSFGFISIFLVISICVLIKLIGKESCE
jgi:MFS family permease